MKEGTDFAGNNLQAEIESSTWDSCLLLCMQTDGCLAITYGKSGDNLNKCWLKNQETASGSVSADFDSVNLSCFSGLLYFDNPKHRLFPLGFLS